MEKFFEGFEKQAVSMDWAVKRVIGGLASRARNKNLGKSVIQKWERGVKGTTPEIKADLANHRFSRSRGRELMKDFPDIAKTKGNKQLSRDYLQDLSLTFDR